MMIANRFGKYGISFIQVKHDNGVIFFGVTNTRRYAVKFNKYIKLSASENFSDAAEAIIELNDEW